MAAAVAVESKVNLLKPSARKVADSISLKLSASLSSVTVETEKSLKAANDVIFKAAKTLKDTAVLENGVKNLVAASQECKGIELAWKQLIADKAMLEEFYSVKQEPDAKLSEKFLEFKPKNPGKLETHDFWKKFQSAVQAKKRGDDDVEIMDEDNSSRFICPFSKLPMTQPMVNELCQHVYDNSSVLTMLKSTNKCPVRGCNQVIDKNRLVPDENLMYDIEEARKKPKKRTKKQKEDIDEADDAPAKTSTTKKKKPIQKDVEDEDIDDAPAKSSSKKKKKRSQDDDGEE